MSSLIIMAVFDTDENGRSEYTEKTLESLFHTVDWSKHRLVVIDNGSCDRTKVFLSSGDWYMLITNKENVGTARAINQGLALRKSGEYCAKIDNDIVVHQSGWVEELEEAIRRDDTIGIAALKRVDLEEHPDHELEHYRSRFYYPKREKGMSWLAVEHVQHCMGSCTMFNPKFLDKAGYMWQKGLYALDDYEFAVRCNTIGFKNVFLPHIPIEHIDAGGTEYTDWKVKYAGTVWNDTVERIRAYISGEIPIYYNGEFND